MVPEYRRTVNKSPDPRESEPVLYVYPDGIYTKNQKRQRIDRFFRGWGALRNDPAWRDHPVPAHQTFDEAEKKDFYQADGDSDRTYKVSFDLPGSGDTILVSRATDGEKAGEGKKNGGLFGSSRERNRKDLKEVKEKAIRRRRIIEHRRGLFITLIIAAFFIVILSLIYKFFFVVRNIRVEGNGRYTAEEIIEASGVRYGANLYSFRASRAGERVTFGCPYIESVKIHRVVPNGVVMEVTEDVPKYYSVIHGETKILSDGLRVLDTVSDGEELPQGMIKVMLPEVTYSVEGRLLVFKYERNDRVIHDILTAVGESPLSDRVNSVDVRSQFDIRIVCDGKYLLELGSSSDAALKLKTASYVLEDEMFKNDDKAKIDLTHPEKTSVIVDNSLVLD